MTTTIGISFVSSSKLASCFEVVAHYGIKPNFYFLVYKEGMHCEVCHESGHLGQTTVVSGKTYEVCCAVDWAVEQIKRPPYRTH